jgi:FkbM family methyltransferase
MRSPGVVTRLVKNFIPQSLRTSWREMLNRQRLNSEQQVVTEFLAHTGADTVLDVGANVGQFGDLVLRTGFVGKIISFEAIPEVHQQLVRHARKKSDSWIVAPCAALGSTRGKIAINIAANTVSSSVLPMLGAHKDAAPQSIYVNELIVDLERLDEHASQLLPPDGRLIIKIDTQGYEMEVLKGASGLLHQTVGIQLELSLTPLYEGAPSFTDMISFVKLCGYDLFSIVPGFQDERTGRLLQVDGFFVQSSREKTETR